MVVRCVCEFWHQDVIFLNVLLCIFRMDNVDEKMQYEIIAFKFHDINDVRRLAETFQRWTGSSPVEKLSGAGSIHMMRSLHGGSMHSLMPGRPAHGSLTADRLSARRFNSLGDLTAGTQSEVFYPATSRTMVVQNKPGYINNNNNSVYYDGRRQQLMSTNSRRVMTPDSGLSLIFLPISLNFNLWDTGVISSSSKKEWDEN